jgi:multicomponent Na+:H+ antiporter subunit D
VLFFSALAFLWLQLRGLYPPELPGINIDAEWIYRKALPRIALWITGLAAGVRDLVLQQVRSKLFHFLEGLYRTHGPEGALARTRPSGYMALWMTVLLSVFLLLSFLKLPVLRSARAEMITARQRAGRER